MVYFVMGAGLYDYLDRWGSNKADYWDIKNAATNVIVAA